MRERVSECVCVCVCVCVSHRFVAMALTRLENENNWKSILLLAYADFYAFYSSVREYHRQALHRE